MSRTSDLFITAMAPAIWGSTYIVTTELLPAGYPITASALRALPAGLLLLLIVRQLPKGEWWWKSALLGAFNFTIFQTMLFISAYRLPGGVAATVGAIQPLIVLVLARFFIGNPIRPLSILAGLAGIAGVALLVLTPHAKLDMIGILAGLAGAVSMAFGTVLSRHWQPPVSPLTVTAWQLTAGGVLLVPIALAFEPTLPPLTPNNWLGFLWLGLVGGAFAYIIWFRGISRLEPAAVSPLGFLSPLMAVILGWILLGQQLSVLQMTGMAVVLASVWMSQVAQTRNFRSKLAVAKA
jgi:probable blue pigment (indigoidine) exporter